MTSLSGPPPLWECHLQSSSGRIRIPGNGMCDYLRKSTEKGLFWGSTQEPDQLWVIHLVCGTAAAIVFPYETPLLRGSL